MEEHVIMRHLAIFIGDAIEKILKGEKTVEGRFTLDKIPPYEKIQKGDEILLKRAGGNIIGKVIVDNVLFYEKLDGEAIGKLRKEYNDEMCVDDDFWKAKARARCATLIFLKKPQRFLAPLRSQKRDRRPWVVLDNK